jgi:hypothetical protein
MGVMSPPINRFVRTPPRGPHSPGAGHATMKTSGLPFKRRGFVYWAGACLVLFLALVLPCLAVEKAGRVFNMKHILAPLLK